jgi:hypothetical protein
LTQNRASRTSQDEPLHPSHASCTHHIPAAPTACQLHPPHTSCTHRMPALHPPHTTCQLYPLHPPHANCSCTHRMPAAPTACQLHPPHASCTCRATSLMEAAMPGAGYPVCPQLLDSPTPSPMGVLRLALAVGPSCLGPASWQQASGIFGVC